jgi:anoctamin-10
MKIINEYPVRYFFIKVASFIGSGSFMILGILCNSQIPLLFQYLTGVKYASEVYANSQIYQLLGGIMFGIQINVFNISYNFIARKLTDAENHETIHEHNNSLILKLFIFRFVNSYWNLFEIAFLKDKEKCQNKSCMTELGYRLMIIFSTCLVFNFIEIGLPWVKYWFRILITYKTFSLKNLKKKDEDFEIKLESLLEPYDNTINDYMEIFTMFGYIALFGASHHLIGILALIALFLESRIDSLKLCTIIRRPEPIKSKSIGVWKQLFLFVSLCGIFTNTAISIFTTGLLNDIDPRYKVLLFIFVENSMFLVAAVMWTMVSPVPDVIIRSTNWAKRISHEIEKNPYTKSFWSRSRFVKKSDFQFDLNRRRANTIQQ